MLLAMISFLKNLFATDFPVNANPEAAPSAQSGYKSEAVAAQTLAGRTDAYKALAATGDLNGRADIFDPALRHFGRGYRLGDPDFGSAEDQQTWRAARRVVAEHLLQIVAESPWSNQLVLRGSLPLQAWLGDAAREPGDIDWVFRPATVAMGSRAARTLLADLVRRAGERPRIAGAVVQTNQITVDAIWTYERAAGSRISFPWRVGNLPTGQLQMAIVFGEALLAEPVQTAIPSPLLNGGREITVWTASKELSLAWKLLWLQTDSYPQGKDLYDATLLAESLQETAPLPLKLLRDVLEAGNGLPSNVPFNAPFVLEWKVDWDNFLIEYPWVQGTAIEWQARLAEALAPTFAPARH